MTTTPTPTPVDISGTTLEIRVTEIKTGQWRWLLCAVAQPWPSGHERHLHAWGGTAPTAQAAFSAAMDARAQALAPTA